jgi:hypothetical protein
MASQEPVIDLPLDDERAPLKVKRTDLPKKPRRYFLPALVLCIILRLEIFHRVSSDLQCSKPGIEVRAPPCQLSSEGMLTDQRRPSCLYWSSCTSSSRAAGHGLVTAMMRRRSSFP